MSVIKYHGSELSYAQLSPFDNVKSRLLETLGFRKEAHFIKSYRMNDQWVDDCVYAMLAEEWT